MSVLRVALTGGIGSGKSTVAACFACRAVTVIDADAISHQLTGPGGAAMPAIAEVFGPKSRQSSGALDRAWMRELVFQDPEARLRLEAILHPRIRREMLAQASKDPGPYSLLVIPLLFETGQQTLVDRVLVVDLPEAEQVRRVHIRDGLDHQTINAMLASQVDRERRLGGADDVIDNAGSPPALDARVAELHGQYLALARQKAAAARDGV